MQLFVGATHVAALVTAGQAEQLPVLPHMGELIFGLIAIAHVGQNGELVGLAGGHQSCDVRRTGE